MMSTWAALLFLAAATEPSNYLPTEAELAKAYERADRLPAERRDLVLRARLQIQWVDSGHFWYRDQRPDGTREFILVDCEKSSRGPAFDHVKLAAALAAATKQAVDGKRLPFDSISYRDDRKLVSFRAFSKDWVCDLATYVCKADEGPKPAPPPAPKRDAPPRRSSSGTSPDGKWTVSIKDHNVVLRSADGKLEHILTKDGTAAIPYGSVSWSPNSKTFLAYRTDLAERKEVYRVESSPSSGGRARLLSQPYPLPGDKFSSHAMWLFDVESRKPIKVEAEKVDFGFPTPRWKADGSVFWYEKTDRGHQRFRLIEVEARTGKTRAVIDEQSKTFINSWARYLHYCANEEEVILASERDGWRHLYLIDLKKGSVKNRITQGPWVVRAPWSVNEAKRHLFFRASGVTPGIDPYLMHDYRVNFDGTGLVNLTPVPGQAYVSVGPEERYHVTTWSRVDSPPVHEVRRMNDGSLVFEFDRADVSALRAKGWKPPEVFVSKGRDGKTDIWGMVVRPSNFDPSKMYPVIEYIYAGPHGSHVPKEFQAYHRMESMAELGFIVVQCDGMGTANRSKEFHDVCWKNLADAGFPDRKAWIKALGKKYPSLDLSRVGIYGTSAGGQNSTGALLFHGDFYKVAVSSCGCHDNRMDKASWNEQWMGYPVGPHYADQSNITHASKLKGKLLLIVGELDTNVPPESTLRLADALIKARKDFELLVVPGMGHSDGGWFGERRRRDFFVRHLHGVAPPPWPDR